MPSASTGHHLTPRFATLFVFFAIHHRRYFFVTCFALDTRRDTTFSARTFAQSTLKAGVNKKDRFESAGLHTMSESSAHNEALTNDKPSLLLSNIHKISRNSSAPTPSSLRLILASASPRRREILDMMGLSNRYTVRPSPLDEKAFQTELMSGDGIEPKEYARILAEKKAGALCELIVSRRQQQGGEDERVTTLVIGSDTIVDFQGHILEKPDDTKDAYDMLNRLSGHWHMVHTGVAVYAILGNEAQRTRYKTSEEGDNHLRLMSSFTDTARVKFASLSEEDILSYIATKEPMDKAGSYGIQGIGGQLVENMEGDFFTVMGLPMHRLSRCLNGAIAELGF
ncbi:hypothetical protein ACHAWX_004375 [Stephanocyclus meneghinianus]